MQYIYLLEQAAVRPHAKKLNKIEIKLTDLGIKGPIIKLDALTNSGKTIEEHTKHEDTHVIVIGDQKFFTRIVRHLPLNEQILLGYIPLGGGPKTLAHQLNIPEGVRACEVVAARRIRKIDLGHTSEGLFTSSLEIFSPCTMICDEKYRILSEKTNYYCINNLAPILSHQPWLSRPNDGVMNIFFTTVTETNWHKKKHLSQCLIRKSLEILPFTDFLSLALDGTVVKCARLSFTLLPRALSMIVGKNCLT